MRRIGTIDERFQSFNVEMVEVTGGRFWKPYSARDDPANLLKTTPPAVARKSDLCAKRSPIDLADAPLRRFASALSPTYLRVTGMPSGPGAVIFAPATITFLTISDAGNRHCQ
jgi:heparanase 1